MFKRSEHDRRLGVSPESWWTFSPVCLFVFDTLWFPHSRLVGSDILVLCPRPGCWGLPIVHLSFAVNPPTPYFNCSLPEECGTCNSCNFLRLGLFFKWMILYYNPFVEQVSTGNALAAQALHYSHGLHLQHQKLFLQVYYKLKQKKCHVGKLSWLTKIHKYYLFLQNYLSINLINFFTVKKITWVCDKNVKLGFQYRRQLCVDIVLLFLFRGNTQRHIALNLITLSKYWEFWQ